MTAPTIGDQINEARRKYFLAKEKAGSAYNTWHDLVEARTKLESLAQLALQKDVT